MRVFVSVLLVVGTYLPHNQRHVHGVACISVSGCVWQREHVHFPFFFFFPLLPFSLTGVQTSFIPALTPNVRETHGGARLCVRHNKVFVRVFFSFPFFFILFSPLYLAL